jgi:hypothetical protein
MPPDSRGNYSEEEIQILSDSYSRIDVYRDGVKIIQNGELIPGAIKQAEKGKEKK